MLLRKDQIAFYRTNGYLIVENVLTADQVAEGRRIVDEFTERSRAVSESNEVFDLEPGHTADRPAIRRLKQPAKQHPFFNEVLHSHAIPVEMKAGSIEIHHVRMLHGSAPNTSPNPRRLLLFDMAAADAFPIGLSIGDLGAYNAQIVRGTPQQPRTAEQPPVRLPFPVRTVGTIYEVQKQLRESAFVGSRT